MSDTPTKPAEQAEPSDEHVVRQFPYSDEDHKRRLMVEVKRQADAPPDVWKNWYPTPDAWYAGIAKEHGITPEQFAELVKAERKNREEKLEVEFKDRKQNLAEERLVEQRAERLRKTEGARQREQQRIEDAAKSKTKDKSKTFAEIIKLPAEQHEAKLEALAKTLDEDVATLRAEFVEYCGAELPKLSEWGDVEPWPEPVPTVIVLEEIIDRINKHIKAKPHQVLAIALWILMSWVHEEAAQYSVYLVATSPEKGHGKTTLIIKVIGRLVPKPHPIGSPTLAGIFRMADREKPTQLFDNVDNLFSDKPEIADLFLYGSIKGVKIPRTERRNGEWVTIEYDPFCPKACSLIGTKLPEPLLDRSLLIELWPLKQGDKVDEVNPFDTDLIDQFKVLRQKCARWRDDNVATLKTAKPLLPAGFIGRPSDNWKLLLAIAELAGDAMAELARKAAEHLSRDELIEPSWLNLLLQELWTVFVEKGRKDITSAQLVARLTADPISPWCDYGHHGGRGHRVTQREIAALLRKLHIRPRLVGTDRMGGYHAIDFFEKEVFQHFLHRDPLILSPDTQSKKSAPKKVKKSRRKK